MEQKLKFNTLIENSIFREEYDVPYSNRNDSQSNIKKFLKWLLSNKPASGIEQSDVDNYTPQLADDTLKQLLGYKECMGHSEWVIIVDEWLVHPRKRGKGQPDIPYVPGRSDRVVVISKFEGTHKDLLPWIYSNTGDPSAIPKRKVTVKNINSVDYTQKTNSNGITQLFDPEDKLPNGTVRFNPSAKARDAVDSEDTTTLIFSYTRKTSSTTWEYNMQEFSAQYRLNTTDINSAELTADLRTRMNTNLTCSMTNRLKKSGITDEEGLYRLLNVIPAGTFSINIHDAIENRTLFTKSGDKISFNKSIIMESIDEPIIDYVSSKIIAQINARKVSSADKNLTGTSKDAIDLASCYVAGSALSKEDVVQFYKSDFRYMTVILFGKLADPKAIHYYEKINELERILDSKNSQYFELDLQVHMIYCSAMDGSSQFRRGGKAEVWEEKILVGRKRFPLNNNEIRGKYAVTEITSDVQVARNKIIAARLELQNELIKDNRTYNDIHLRFNPKSPQTPAILPFLERISLMLPSVK